ncbi:MAG TPA: ATP-binding protein [Gaiellaceae bacterium]|nr:ATP-binding protein [Gaiellaceae bacterium]
MTTNPFQYGDLALDEAFTDRRAELDALTSDMLNGQNVAIIAPRRFGKSSLVKRASQELVGDGVLVAEVDLMKTPTKEKLASKLSKTIHDDIASPLFNVKERLRLFSTLRISPVITVDPRDGSPSFSFSASHSDEDIDATLERLLELPAQFAAERNRRVVVFFDEFQEVTTIDARLPALMRAVFQEQPDVAHVYSGSRRDMMRTLFTHQNEPFFRSAKVLELGVIPPDLFKTFLVSRFDGTNRRLPGDVVDAMLAITGGHPYATQELAYALWELVPEGFTASPEDFDRALQSVLHAENAHFTLVWESASRAQRLLLQAIADEPGRVQGEAYRQRHGLPAASTVQRAAETLASEELLARGEDGAYHIAEPFLREWILLHAA